MSLYALGASFGQRSVPPRDLVAQFIRERLLGDGRFTGDLDCLNRIRVRAETVNEMLDEVIGSASSVWVLGASLEGRFVRYASMVQQWTEVDTPERLQRKSELVEEGGFGSSWEGVRQLTGESVPVGDLGSDAVVLLDGAGDRVGWESVAGWLTELVGVSGVRVVLDLPVAAQARTMGLSRAALKASGWVLEAEVHFAEREPLIVAGGVEIASGMPSLRVIRLRSC